MHRVQRLNSSFSDGYRGAQRTRNHDKPTAPRRAVLCLFFIRQLLRREVFIDKASSGEGSFNRWTAEGCCSHRRSIHLEGFVHLGAAIFGSVSLGENHRSGERRIRILVGPSCLGSDCRMAKVTRTWTRVFGCRSIKAFQASPSWTSMERWSPARRTVSVNQQPKSG